jgi:hypothetical protein
VLTAATELVFDPSVAVDGTAAFDGPDVVGLSVPPELTCRAISRIAGGFMHQP